jgi:dTDP-4-amino-4,6-dideoxygalactose transaminase
MKKIPFFNYKHIFSLHQENLKKIFTRVSSNGAFIMQEDLKQFEKKISNYTGAKYAVGVGNATDGLEMILELSGLKKNSEIILSSHTMVATASSIYFSGHIPKPVDFGSDLLICPDAIKKNITKKTRAIIVTHLNGRTCNMDAINKICKDFNLLLIEDAAQALGSKFKNKFAGTFGFGSSISFYPAKILGCFGDGGIVLTNNKKLYNNLLEYRDHGRFRNGKINRWGINSRLDNLQAAILNYFFNMHKKNVIRRREIANIYNDKLKDISHIKLPPAPNLSKCNDHFDIFQNYEIICEHRNNLRNFLNKNGVGTLIQWSGISINNLNLPKLKSSKLLSDKTFRKLMMLPMNTSLYDKEVFYICKLIRLFYKKYEKKN